MEGRGHRRLKKLAMLFLREHGVHAAAIEVGCPISRYRVDVAGVRDAVSKRRARQRRERAADGSGEAMPNAARTRTACSIMIECKAARSDFLSDNHLTPKLLKRRRELETFRRSIEHHRIPWEEPHLRRAGSSLFPEMDEWDYHASELKGYREVMRKLRRIDAQLYGETKFHMIARYQLADRLYIAAPQGVIRRSELPPGWGLLECPPQWLDDEAHRDRLDDPPRLRVVVDSPHHTSRDEHRQRLLRNIAVAASYAAYHDGKRRGASAKPQAAVER
jgi:hypothetical protein